LETLCRVCTELVQWRQVQCSQSYEWRLMQSGSWSQLCCATSSTLTDAVQCPCHASLSTLGPSMYKMVAVEVAVAVVHIEARTEAQAPAPPELSG
jgi:hypothetical protein